MNLLRVLVEEHDFTQTHISQETGISPQRLSNIKKIDDDSFKKRTWTIESEKLQEFMDTHTRVCSKTGERMTDGFFTDEGLYFKSQDDLMSWLRSLECNDPHITDREYLEWCWYQGIYDYTSWYE